MPASPPTSTGTERAAALLRAKQEADAKTYAQLPPLGSAALNMATETRQTARRAARVEAKRWK